MIKTTRTYIRQQRQTNKTHIALTQKHITRHITVTQNAPNKNRQIMLKHPKQRNHAKHTLTNTTTTQHKQSQIKQPSTRQTH